MDNVSDKLNTSLAKLAHDDPELREALRGFAQSLLAVTGTPKQDVAAFDTTGFNKTGSETTEPSPPERPYIPSYTLPDHINVATMIAHCKLKARASAWLELHGYTRDELALRVRKQIIAEAKDAQCYLWMIDRNVIDPDDQSRHGRLAAYFNLLAEGVELWTRHYHSPAAAELAAIIAEGQAALRSLVADLRQKDGRPWFDPDQGSAYNLMRHYAEATGTDLAALRPDTRPDTDTHHDVADRLARLRPKLARA